ncbi:MAG: haloacid dehalogenase type II [Candidatus Thiodiazotropha sp.]
MAITLAFDVYGTLIDTHGVVTRLESLIGDKARAFSHTWRDKQVEYAFRRGLMQMYEDFSICIRDSLNYACELHETPMSVRQKQELLDLYRELPVFDDVREGLALLSGASYRLFAFSNGTRDDVNSLLGNADIEDYFLDVISADSVRSFKPNPAVYCHLLRETESAGCDSWLISSNPFDVIGALSAGMRGIWLQRSHDQVFDPWGFKPTIRISSLRELEGQLARFLTHK